MHIVIAGNIGSGKSTLTRMLAERYGWRQLQETVAANPYLDDYYRDLHRWAFNLEVFFLKQRFKDLLAISGSRETWVQDRSIYEGVYIFAANNHDMGNLTDRDYETYRELFENMIEIIHQPDLTIYLRASVPHLMGNIQLRGRDYEQSMPLDYMANLNQRYEDFFMKRYQGPLLVIDVDDLDFLHRPRDFAFILDKIDAKLFGFFG